MDPGICSILAFYKKMWESFLHHILCMIFQEKSFFMFHFLFFMSFFMLYNRIYQIPLSDSIYFLRYWAVYVLQMFAPHFVTSYILKLTESFKSRQKEQNLKNETNLQDEIKTFFIIFKVLSVAKNCLRPQSASLSRITVSRAKN